MSSKTLLIRGGGLAAAITAHALFAGVLLAAQPLPDGYLARLAPPAASPAGEAQFARGAAPVVRGAELPTARVVRRLSKGLIEC